MSVTREAILSGDGRRKPVPVDVPEWGGTVWVRILSADDQVRLSQGVEPKEVPGRVLISCLVDESGAQLLRPNDAKQLLKQNDFPVIMRVFTEAARLNGLSSAELEGAVRDLERSPTDS